MLKSTRDAYGEALLRLGELDPRVVALDADLSSSTRSARFAARFPERYFEMGIAEQNLYGVAAGLAAGGKIPFASTFAVFATERAFNQIRQSIAYPNLNVKIVSSHGGFTASGDGGSHQSLIDVSLMRSLPNMTVIVPADAVQAGQAVLAAAGHPGPVYLRLGKSEVPVLFDPGSPFRIGEAVEVRPGLDVTVLVAGTLLGQALEAAEALAREGISVELLSVHTVKPLDRERILGSARKTGAVVTVEEHSVIGGLGGAVAELLAASHPVPMSFVGVNDVFGESGTEQELYARHGLTAQGISGKVRELLRRRDPGRGMERV
jgi:transketolase